MKKTARRASTQAFTEILDIIDNIVVVGGGNACSIIEVSATNFTLQSADEQWAKISSYASLLNSLSFPIQILIRSKRVDISNYLKSLDYQASSNPNKVLASHITKYRNFISELIKQNSVLDKKFYIVLSYSYLEKGAIGAAKSKTKKEEAIPGESLEAFHRSNLTVTDIIAPSSVEIDFGHIRVGDHFFKTFFVVGYPRFVSPNWLEPLINFDSAMNICMFVYPASSPDVLSDLKRKIAEMEATLASDAERGLEIDPKVSAQLEDAIAVQEELAKGVERFFQFSLYITLIAESKDALEEASRNLKTLLSSILILAKPATLQMAEGFKSTTPMGWDRLLITRNMDTTSLASTFPFTSATLTQDKGVLYGINQLNSSLIIFDRYSLENANEVVFGKEVIVMDPEGEYGKLTAAMGGEYVSFTPNSPIKINPFDLSGIYEEGENELGLKILSLHGLLKIVMGELDAPHDAILDRELVETYRQKGITTDPATQKKRTS